MRLLSGNVPSMLHRHKPGFRFQVGEAQIIRKGGDLLVISSGFMTMRAPDAAEKLKADRIDAAVLHSPTIKPLGVETIEREDRNGSHLIVTAENHTTIGGPGEATGTALMRAGVAATFRQIGRPDASAGSAPCRSCKTSTSSRPAGSSDRSRAGCDLGKRRPPDR